MQTVGMGHCLSCCQVNFFVQQMLKIMIVNMQSLAPMSLQRTFFYCQVSAVRWTPSRRCFETGCKTSLHGQPIHRSIVLKDALLHRGRDYIKQHGWRHAFLWDAYGYQVIVRDWGWSKLRSLPSARRMMFSWVIRASWILTAAQCFLDRG